MYLILCNLLKQMVRLVLCSSYGNSILCAVHYITVANLATLIYYLLFERRSVSFAMRRSLLGPALLLVCLVSMRDCTAYALPSTKTGSGRGIQSSGSALSGSGGTSRGGNSSPLLLMRRAKEVALGTSSLSSSSDEVVVASDVKTVSPLDSFLPRGDDLDKRCVYFSLG